MKVSRRYPRKTQLNRPEPDCFSIAITGTFGAGKSTVASIFGKEGIPVLDADQLAHQVLEKPAIIRKIKEHFGEKVLAPDGSPDRKKLAAEVFNSSSQRRYLEKLTHPQVFSLLRRKMLDFWKKGSKMVCVEIPLLFETSAEDLFDFIVVVHASPEAIKRRLRGIFTPEEIEKRWKSQWPQERKLAHADFTIDNNHSFRDIRSQVKEILKKCQQRWNQSRLA
ncbi:MAG TPA: dephospho-CoA kinase [bacterium]|nr:dephospho-CoA kinase [bacterium]